MRSVMYNRNAVRDAAKFICEKNPAAKQWPDVMGDPLKLEVDIKRMIEEGAARNDLDHTSTGGWFIVFIRPDKGVDAPILAEVYVDPSVSEPTVYDEVDF